MPLTHLRHGARQRHVPVLLVHVDRVGAAVVAHPDAEVLHLQRLLLEDLRKGARGTGWSVPVLSGAPRQPVPAASCPPQPAASRQPTGACAVQPAPPEPSRRPPPTTRPKAQGSGRRTSLHAMISPFMRLIRLNCLMKYQNLLFARTCGHGAPTLASARETAEAREHSALPARRAKQRHYPSVSPASPCTPAPARAPAGSAASFPAPLR